MNKKFNAIAIIAIFSAILLSWAGGHVAFADTLTQLTLTFSGNTGSTDTATCDYLNSFTQGGTMSVHAWTPQRSEVVSNGLTETNWDSFYGNANFGTPTNICSLVFPFDSTFSGFNTAGTSYIYFWDDLHNPLGYMQYNYNGVSTNGETTFSGPPPTNTRIVSITPVNHGTSTSPVAFQLKVYINSDDLGIFSSLKLDFSYQGQPLGVEHFLLNSVRATTTGMVTFNYSVPLSTGNYILNAHIKTTYLFGVFENPFGGSQAQQSNQFSVGTSTDFHSTFFQRTIDSISEGISSSTANASTACNPIAGSFDLGLCIIGIIYPDPSLIQQDISELTSIPPWGYAFRLYDLATGNATSTASTTLPSITYTFASTSPFSSIGTITFDPFGALLDAGNIVNAKSDQTLPKTMWEILEPAIDLIVYLMLIFMVIHDITGIGWHNKKDK